MSQNCKEKPNNNLVTLKSKRKSGLVTNCPAYAFKSSLQKRLLALRSALDARHALVTLAPFLLVSVALDKCNVLFSQPQPCQERQEKTFQNHSTARK